MQALNSAVQAYIENADNFDGNPQLRINPVSFDIELVNGSGMMSEIEYSDEAVEDAAAAQGAATMDDTDFQASQDPDFYAVKRLLTRNAANFTVPDPKALAKIADYYFPA